MYRKIIQRKDEKHFGTTITIYKSEKNFLVIINGRDGETHYFVDLQLTRLYPVKIHTQADTSELTLDYSCDIDLQKLGFSKCPDWIHSLISESENSTGDGTAC